MTGDEILTAQYATMAACPSCGRSVNVPGSVVRYGKTMPCTNGACLKQFRPADLPKVQTHIRKTNKRYAGALSLMPPPL